MAENHANGALVHQEEESPNPKRDFSAEKKADSYNEVSDDQKALVPVVFSQKEFASPTKISATAQKNVADLDNEKGTGRSTDRDAALARVEIERRLALIKAWEDNEKTKLDNKAFKKLSAVDSWENIKRALAEAEMKEIEEKIEKKKAEYAEKINNKMAIIHKQAEEKRALVEANHGKEVVMVEKAAAHFREAGRTPKSLFACFRC